MTEPSGNGTRAALEETRMATNSNLEEKGKAIHLWSRASDSGMAVGWTGWGIPSATSLNNAFNQ